MEKFDRLKRGRPVHRGEMNKRMGYLLKYVKHAKKVNIPRAEV